MGKQHLWAGFLVAACGAGCDKLPFNLGGGGTASSTSAAAPAAPQAQVTDPGVLAIVNGTPLPLEMYRRRVTALPEDDPRGFATSLGSSRIVHRKPRTVEERALLLDELIKEELAVQEAMSLGLERDPDTKRRIEDTRRLVLLAKLNERILDEVKEIPETEVQDFYQKNLAIFKTPERLRVRQLVVPDLKQAEALRATIVGGADFASLASQHSIGAGKDQGGDVGWYVRELDRQLASFSGTDLGGAGTFFPQLEPLAFALEADQVSQPVKGPEGYYIVRLEERTPEVTKPLAQISDQLKQALLFQKQQQKVQDYFDRMWDKNKAKVERNERRLQQEL